MQETRARRILETAVCEESVGPLCDGDSGVYSIAQIRASQRERLIPLTHYGISVACICTLIQESEVSMLGLLLVVVLILFLIGALPAWPHSRNWGYFPTGGVGLVLVIVVVLILMGQI